METAEGSGMWITWNEHGDQPAWGSLILFVEAPRVTSTELESAMIPTQ
jgi:hypothetical protein